MTFGKPRQTTDPVRCLNCGEQYPERQVILEYAGRTEDSDFWNCRCPECGVNNGMHQKYAELSDDEFRATQHETARYRRESIREQRRRRKRS